MSLKPVLKIRQSRVKEADDKVRACKAVVREKLAAQEQAEQNLAAFRTSRPDREAALFDAMKGKTLGVSAFDDYRAGLRNMDLEEKRLGELINEVKKEVKKVEKDLEKATKEYDTIVRSVEKLEEFVKLEREEEARLAAEAEEAEMEDFLLAKMSRRGGADED
ncbi:MAG: YscO family type III secretion system apparatus protein [Candidatus Competibacterales bacterium]